MNSEAFTVIYNKALDLVSRREHSQYELIQKLNKRFPETMPVIEEVIKKLAVNNILNDERFAEMYLNSRARKGFGPKKIEMELNFKKVDSSFIAIAIAEYESWTENAQNELLKKFKGVKPTDYNSKMKQKQFLFNRGFSSQIIERIL
jgi:regulatory protein